MNRDIPGFLRLFLQVLFTVGTKRRLDGWRHTAIQVYGVMFALWTFYAATMAIIAPLALCAIYYSFAMVLLFLLFGGQGKAKGPPGIIDVCLAGLSGCCGLYFLVQAESIVARISLLDPLSSWDIFFGTLVWVLTMEATRRSVGLGLMLIVSAFILYNLFGDRLEGIIGHGIITYDHFLDQTIFTTNGIFGAPLQVAATYAFLFVAFGTLLEEVKGGAFFFDLAAAVSGKTPGGPAKVAVSSSALFGMISGSPTSDVVTTGAVTIPMMRRLGYPAVLAGAIEVVASTSGGIIPPVMGSAAFIMVEFTGLEYRQIAISAVLPALLYCAAIYTRVHVMSMRLELPPMEKASIRPIRSILAEGGVFFIPFATLLMALFKGYSVTYVAVFAMLALLVVTTLNKTTRITPAGVYRVLATTTMRMIPVIAACASAGLVVGGASMTGLAGKVGHLIYMVAGQNLFIALVVSAGVAILLGMGMPTPSAYIMAAVLVAPVLVDMGVGLLSVHMFILFYAVLSAITPPVAVAAYAASSIAEANPMLIAMKAVDLAIPLFLIPFMFVWSPQLLGEGTLLQVVFSFSSALCGIVLLSVAGEGYWRGHLAWGKRVVIAISGIALVSPGYIATVLGLMLLGSIWCYVLLNKTRNHMELVS